jgi:molybdopterin converting factor subunit 1
MEGSGPGDAGSAGGEREKTTRKAGEVQALLFARAQELAGVSAIALEIQEGWTTANCFAAVVAKYPALESISSCMMVALNYDYVTEPVLVKDGDELALIPPISGG